MEKGLLDLHNLLRWVVLLLALLTVFGSLSGMTSGKTFTARNKKIALFFLISCDLQLLIGLALYFLGPWGIKNMQNMGMGAAMKDPVSRFFGVEHAIGMLIAIVLVHIGYSSAKKNVADSAKFKKLFWYTVCALLIMIITIPWPFREAIARPLFPGM